jgi:hypothetical protein
VSAAFHHARATVDDRLHASLSELVALAYARTPGEGEDVPAHVRAASAVRRRGARLVIVQDDVNVIALHDPRAGTSPLLLPLGPGGRRTFGDELGNKHAKMDLEACATLPDGRLVAFGSGSTTARETIVVLDPSDGVRLVDGSALYEMLRSTPQLSGSELNLEGALVVGDALRLVQRGNGAPADGNVPVDATADLALDAFCRWLDDRAPLPRIREIVQYDLGAVRGARFGFTDAAALPDGRMAFLACAEASPDTYRDGEVLGCRFGIAHGSHVRTTDVRDADGRCTTLKLEGIELREIGEAMVFDVVVDVDRPEEPARLGRLDVRGA